MLRNFIYGAVFLLLKVRLDGILTLDWSCLDSVLVHELADGVTRHPCLTLSILTGSRLALPGVNLLLVAPKTEFVIGSELGGSAAPGDRLLRDRQLVLWQIRRGAARLYLLLLADRQVLHDHVFVDLVAFQVFGLLLT